MTMRLLAAALLLLLTQRVWAQVSWRQKEGPAPQSAMAMAYDSARSCIVMFGGSETWEFDGAAWRRRLPSSSPAARGNHAMAYDARRQRVVLFGGGTVGTADTWEWDGTTWTRRFPATSPPPRYAHTMVYDAARERIVLFGGAGFAVRFGDTWEWDGTTWTLAQPSRNPPARTQAAMAYDAARGVAVLFGGEPSSLGDTWEWDGTTWRQRFPATRPRGRSGHAMVYDAVRGRVLLFGGSDPLPANDSWEWDGTSWSQLTAAHLPHPRQDHAMIYDVARRRAVLFGGRYPSITRGPITFGDTWEWDGTAWSPRPEATVAPGRLSPGMAHDPVRARVVCFGGHFAGPTSLTPVSDTWEWDGTGWHFPNPATTPGPRTGHGMAWDGTRGQVILFGGTNDAFGTPVLSDTWAWDGSTWANLAPARAPSARAWFAMAADPPRGRVVLFGGRLGSGFSAGDTWEWDGTIWEPKATSRAPSPRQGSAMTCDVGRGRVVLFGGGNTQDTWEWDGTTWHERSVDVSPSPRAGHALAYDALRERVVLYGGNTAQGRSADDTWEWDGTRWIERRPVARPSPRAGHGLAYHASAGHTLLFGGTVDARFQTLVSSETWLYASLAPAHYERFGLGCPGSFGPPSLSPRSGGLPWSGQTFAFELVNLPPAQPAVLLLGGSRTTWGAVELPLELGFVGMPGCRLYVRPDLAAPLANPSGTATLSLAVPPEPGLVGVSLYAQGGVVDPPANPAGVVLSDGAQARVGAK